MFLLILAGTLKTGQSNPDFTFHNVSINTSFHWLFRNPEILFTFHNVSINTASGSGQAAGTSDFTFHNVSINTDIDWGNKEVIIYFTFHNVSINTAQQHQARFTTHVFTFHNVSINTEHLQKMPPALFALHSTMFLLIRKKHCIP